MSRFEAHGWSIVAHTGPISNAAELAALNDELRIPLPEMTFGANRLELMHAASGWIYVFDTLGALQAVRAGALQPGDGGVKVGYADAWLRSRTAPDSSIPLPPTSDPSPYDWTYTSTYVGHSTSLPHAFRPSDPSDPAQAIPIAELSRRDPIAFFAEIPLFEDELHDNGASQTVVRIRVMPSCFFILLRFTLRVDNVLFRTFETRIYHSFRSDPPLLVRETKGREAPYDMVKAHLPDKEDLTPLTDANFIAQSFESISSSVTERKGAGTKWRGMGTKLEYIVLTPPLS